MRTLEEVNAILKHHLEVAVNEVEPKPPTDGNWVAWQYEFNKNKKKHAKERERLTLMRNYLERVSPENIAANHKRLSDQIHKLEETWRQHSATFPSSMTSTVFQKRKKQYEKETELTKLRKQLKEVSWLIS